MADDASRRGELATDAPKGDSAAMALAQKPKLVVARPDPANAPKEEKNKVIHIVRRLQEETLQSRVVKRQPWLIGSILACVALPTFLAALFYVFIASDRYVSEAHFAVRKAEEQSVDALGMITGLPSSQSASDSYIVADYVASRDMVEEMERRLPLRAMFAKGDFFSRLSSDVTLEDVVKYWQKHVGIYFDSTKNTISVEVQAFEPADADRIAREVVDIVRILVNDLSAQARRDAVQFAASEVALSELRVRGARQDMLAFRVAHNELDPAQTAQATLGIAAELEGERSRLASELASLSGYLSDDAPSVQMLKARIAALGGEITRIQGQISSGGSSTTLRGSAKSSETDPDPNAMASVIGSYQELLVSQEFAEKAYTAAMASLEHARAEATRSQSYLAIFGQPGIAQEAAYPKRVLNISVVFVLALILWSIGALGVLTIRDHIR